MEELCYSSTEQHISSMFLLLQPSADVHPCLHSELGIGGISCETSSPAKEDWNHNTALNLNKEATAVYEGCYH